MSSTVSCRALPGPLLLLVATAATAQTPDAGQQSFVSRCARCHGTDGNGGEFGPSITARVPVRTDDDLVALFRDGLPSAGMPAIPSLESSETAALIRYLRTLRPRNRTAAARRPGGATWLTGTYDPELDTLYWPVGNPGPDFIGDERAGARHAAQAARPCQSQRFSLRPRSDEWEISLWHALREEPDVGNGSHP